ncbi:hypothetical protein [Streptomyces sp. NPDC004629]|uniref:terpene synthase family protein n=1 Tax=Streptomyces sp. NPDC004629 TaxID=3364705 RepID=UPI00367A2960
MIDPPASAFGVPFTLNPQATQLDIPWPPGLSMDDAASERNITWMRRFDLFALLRHPAGEKVYRYWRGPELAARFFPSATGPDLDIGMDVMSIIFAADDLFEPSDLDPDQVHDQIQEPLQALHQPSRCWKSPLAAALADVWKRERDGMSASWRERAMQNWQEYLHGLIQEAQNKSQRKTLSVEQYLQLRRTQGAMPILLDAAERVDRAELPPIALDCTQFDELRHLCGRIGDTVNDVFSWAKEDALGDPHCLILVLERTRNLTRPEAIDAAADIIRNWTDEFLTLTAQLPAALDDRQLFDHGSRQTVWTHVRSMQTMMRACYDWCRTSPRYHITAPGPQRSEQP